MDLQVEVSTADSIPLVSVVGELDAIAAPQLDNVLAPLLAGDTGAGLVLDLAGVTFMDSSGLGVCIKAIKGVRANSGEVALVVTTPRVLKVLEITGIDKAVTVVDSVADALATLQ